MLFYVRSLYLFIFFGAAIFDLVIEGNRFKTKHESTLLKIAFRFKRFIIDQITRNCLAVDCNVNIKRTGNLKHASLQDIVFISFLFNQMINLSLSLSKSKNSKECVSNGENYRILREYINYVLSPLT